MTGFVYLCSPYTHESINVRETRYQAACRAAGFLMKQGHIVFSPIAHSHPIEILGIGSQMSGTFWKRQDIPILRHASKVIVLCMDGWNESKGIRWEIDTAESLDIPVEYLQPSDIE